MSFWTNSGSTWFIYIFQGLNLPSFPEPTFISTCPLMVIVYLSNGISAAYVCWLMWILKAARVIFQVQIKVEIGEPLGKLICPLNSVRSGETVRYVTLMSTYGTVWIIGYSQESLLWAFASTSRHGPTQLHIVARIVLLCREMALL